VTEVAVHQLLHPALVREASLRAARPQPEVAIRAADTADIPEIERLAALDTSPLAAVELPARVRAGGVLVAESGGRVLAALGVRDGLAIADPFVRSAQLVRLLRLRASQLARA
jgi:hypothetical protein